jgi:hypothetical protein
MTRSAVAQSDPRVLEAACFAERTVGHVEWLQAERGTASYGTVRPGCPVQIVKQPVVDATGDEWALIELSGPVKLRARVSRVALNVYLSKEVTLIPDFIWMLRFEPTSLEAGDSRRALVGTAAGNFWLPCTVFQSRPPSRPSVGCEEYLPPATQPTRENFKNLVSWVPRSTIRRGSDSYRPMMNIGQLLEQRKNEARVVVHDYGHGLKVDGWIPLRLLSKDRRLPIWGGRGGHGSVDETEAVRASSTFKGAPFELPRAQGLRLTPESTDAFALLPRGSVVALLERKGAFAQVQFAWPAGALARACYVLRGWLPSAGLVPVAGSGGSGR